MPEIKISKLKLQLIGICVLSLYSFSAVVMPAITLQSSEKIEITSPETGDALIGSITISGTSDIPGFDHSELSFSYAKAWRETWFIISTSDRPIQSAQLAVWNTSTISDDDYLLRLRVFLADGTCKELIIKNLYVRNYTPTDKPIPSKTPTLKDATSNPVIVATKTLVVVPTMLPANPIELDPQQVYISLLSGIAILYALIILTGIFSRLRRR
jgi:hypothetical protein